MKSGQEKLQETVSSIAPIDSRLMQQAQARLDNLTKPQGSLGRLEEFARRVVAIKQETSPRLDRKVVFTVAADHGIARKGVSAYPQEVTAQMVLNFLNGGAAINVLARHVGAKVIVVDAGVAHDFGNPPGLRNLKIGLGTNDISEGPAMSPEQALECLVLGISLFEEESLTCGVDIVGTGDMGIGNTTPSAAIVALITGQSVQEVTGRGTGIDDARLKHKIQLIEKAIEVNRPDPNNGMDVLQKVGGFEIGVLAGICLAAASKRVPVVIDGLVSTAAALIACQICPTLKDYMFAGHLSAESGHTYALKHLGAEPILDLKMRLGEGTGAVLAMHLIEAGVRTLNEMATFDEAKVSRKGP